MNNKVRLIDANALKAYVLSLSSNLLNEWDTLGVIDAIEKQPTIELDKWIDINDSLPERYIVVLVCVEALEGTYKGQRFVKMAHMFLNKQFCIATGFPPIDYKVTH